VRLLYAVNCEGAEARPDGRLDVRGIFHQLYAPGFPAKQDRIVLALAVEWDAEGAGAQAFKIDLLDPSGSPVLTISGETEIVARVPGEAPPRTLVVLPMEEVIFPTAGTYFYEIDVNGEKTRTTPMHLVESSDSG
jgi:hypothetical protein